MEIVTLLLIAAVLTAILVLTNIERRDSARVPVRAQRRRVTRRR